jgi:hypothetical protein
VIIASTAGHHAMTACIQFTKGAKLINFDSIKDANLMGNNTATPLNQLNALSKITYWR